jgi:hypothetical protein
MICAVKPVQTRNSERFNDLLLGPLVFIWIDYKQAEEKGQEKTPASGLSISLFGVSVHLVFREAPKGWRFENLGSQGWLPGAPGWIDAFLETSGLWGEFW